ncbi:hypothetical protein DN752_16270 [Echinicola strongylocentroti]|uniref:DUF3575 domain-containing protein n=1 Tax=Echinicola strongylocentroti TaxID=1795355 RepID=A0A2Z4IKT4_9BACT|nr:hypothetical protein [Echinicola strongylocentroti]AWW31555.1 hypothetical protein DN752_16270 [Echinicola strongylocentroti]
MKIIKTMCHLGTMFMLCGLLSVELLAQTEESLWRPYTGLGYSGGMTLKDNLVTETFSIGTQWVYNERYIAGVSYQRTFFQEEKRSSKYMGYSYITFTGDLRVLPSKKNGGLYLSGRTGFGLDDAAPSLLQAGLRYGGRYNNSFLDLNAYIGWLNGDRTMLSLGIGYWFGMKKSRKT